MWARRKNTSDLAGYDTSHRTREAEHWGRVRHDKSIAELVDADLVDREALEDTSLTGSENIQEARKRMRDFIRY